MSVRNLLGVVFAFLLLSGSMVFAQQQGQGQNNAQTDEVIQIEAQILDSRAELPQVQILDKRKVSDFDEVKVEKSFRSELSGETEELDFKPVTSGKIKPIKNIKELVNKKRF